MSEALTEAELLATTDAAIWAREFARLHGGDEGLMIGWFANMWAATHDPLQARIEELERERAKLESIWPALAEQFPSEDWQQFADDYDLPYEELSSPGGAWEGGR